MSKPWWICSSQQLCLRTFWVEKNSFWVKAGADVGWGSGGSACLGEIPEWFEEVDFLCPSSPKNLGEESQVLKDFFTKFYVRFLHMAGITTNLTLYFLMLHTYTFRAMIRILDPCSLTSWKAIFTDQLVSTHDKDFGRSFGETELTPQNITGQIVRHHVRCISKRMWLSWTWI